MNPTGEYKDSLDIGNRALGYCGISQRILSVDEDSQNNNVIRNLYNPLRQAELRRRVWKFSKRRAVIRPIEVNTRLLLPQPWSDNTMYSPGSIVRHDNDRYWISFVASNQGNEPGQSTAWVRYWGSATVNKWASGTSYYAGELVWMDGLDVGAHKGGFIVFMSLRNVNTDAPNETTDWDTDTQYGLGETVWYDSHQWRSLITNNKGVTPEEPPNDWSSGVNYSIGEDVRAADGYIYTSLVNDNLAIDPVVDDGTNWDHTGVPAAWSMDPEFYFSSTKWLPLYANMTNIGLEYLQFQIGNVGGNNDNVYHVPVGYLREAKLKPKIMGVEDDHDPVATYLTSRDPIILLEFVADITDVREMDIMFCEGLAARIAVAATPSLTESRGNLQDIATQYNKFMTEAGQVNAIEIGNDPGVEDEYITCRV